jgi:N-acetylglucosamine-6-phosphate deacetylase
MTSILLENARLASGGPAGDRISVLLSGGRIAEITDGCRPSDAERKVDVGGGLLFPGFVDIHIHGAVGVDVNTADASGLMLIAEFLGRNGVTAWVPTLVPDSDDNYRRAVGEIDRLMERQAGRPVAQAVGVHYEGVFANEAMCGALRPEHFKSSGQWSVASGQLPKLKSGVHMTTLAPEIEGGIELIGELVRQGWFVAIGHTRADHETLEKAFAAGARHLTHFYNAMTGLHHRDVGVAGWGLANKEATFDIIADGIHVHPKMLELAGRVKGAEKVSLISDSIAPTGLGDGEFEVWGEKISVADGRTRNERGSIAGSVVTMADAVRTMLGLGFVEAEVANMAAGNPARLIAEDHQRGSIDVGKRADLVVMDDAGEIRMVFMGGGLVE